MEPPLPSPRFAEGGLGVRAMGDSGECAETSRVHSREGRDRRATITYGSVTMRGCERCLGTKDPLRT